MKEKPRVVGVTGGAVMLARLAFIQPYVVAATLILLVLWIEEPVRRRLNPKVSDTLAASDPKN